MAYTKQTWIDDDPVDGLANATRLNHIEQGIEDAHTLASGGSIPAGGTEESTISRVGGAVTWVDEPALIADPARYSGIDLTGATASTGLQTLMDSIASNSYHKSIKLLPGIYYNPTGFTLDRPNVTLEGAGPAGQGISGGSTTFSTTELRADSAGASVLTIGNATTTDWRGCTIKDIGFSDSSAGADQVSYLVRVLRQNNGVIDQCAFHDATAAVGIYAQPTGGNPQYWTVIQPKMIELLKGMSASGTAPDWQVFGGVLWGTRVSNTSPRTGSVGIEDIFSSMKVFGTSIQYWNDEILINAASSQYFGITIEGNNNFTVTKANQGVTFGASSIGNFVTVEYANANRYNTGRAVSFASTSTNNSAIAYTANSVTVDRVVDDNNGSTGNWFRDLGRGGDKWLRMADGGALPTASASYRGQIRMVQGGSGVADALYVCVKNAANAYVWQAL